MSYKASTKILSLEEAMEAVGDDEISVERLEPRLPRRLEPSDAKTKPPGDSDTCDPWQVPDGTADWDVNDPVQ
jgi:hypothetical protein